MKKYLFIVTFIVTFFLFVLPVSAYDSEINKMTITMDVNENGLIQVDQIVEVNFNIDSHGIYAFIPQSYDITWQKNGADIYKSYYFPVRNVKVYDDPYETQSDSYDNVLIKIGDPDKLIIGAHTYHYSYTIQLRDLELAGEQIFYLNLVGSGWVGSGWEMPINQVDFRVTLPKGFPGLINFYSGDTGSVSSNVSFNVEGNTVSGSLTEVLAPYQALTIYTYLSATGDYFTFIPPTDYSFAAIGLLMALSLIIALMFFKFGKDDRPVVTVEFDPPKGMSSAQVGYIFEGIVDSKDVISLIIDWANKGFLTIDEEEGTKNFTLTKLKDIDAGEIRAEKTLFNDLFSGRDAVTNKELEKTFYMSMTKAKSDIARHFYGNPERRIFSIKATVLKVIFGILAMLPVGVFVATEMYVVTYREVESFIIGVVAFGLGTVLVLLWASFVKKYRSLGRLAKVAFLLLGIMVSGIYIIAISSISFLTQDSSSIIKAVIVVVFSFINIALVSVMDKRTPYGVDSIGKILGLKQFIETAEKDRLEMMVKDDPQFFYKILPYAYVLGVTNVWSKKFESIAVQPATWYHGPSYMNSMLFMHHINSTMSSMQRVMTSMPQGRGSGGSFGGGGFSGGGFGGGGGGRW